jgi:hypothetical protein
MPAHGSLLLSLDPGWKPGGFVPAKRQWQDFANLDAEAPVTLSEPNVLLLDQAEWRWNDGSWHKREEILRLDDALRKQLDLPIRGGKMAQLWTDPNPVTVLGTVQLRFTIQSDIGVEKPMLALEEAANAKLEFDGKAVESSAGNEWVDPCIRQIELPSFGPGKHTLIVSLPFTRRTNLEWHYLLGDFGVKVTGREALLTKPVRALRPGSWVEQGLPFYAGNVTYHYNCPGNGRPTLLHVPEFKSPLLSVVVDGKPAGKIAFAPFDLELGSLSSENHRVDVTAFGNRANAFGIVHHTNQDPPWYGPAAWRVTGKDWTYDYNLRTMGILQAPVLKHQPSQGLGL